MNMTENAKAPRVTTEGLSENQNQINAGGIEKRFDGFDNTENPQKIQCQKCNPSFSESCGATEFCAKCQLTTSERKIYFWKTFGGIAKSSNLMLGAFTAIGQNRRR